MRDTWTGERRWPARTWAIVLVLSSLAVLYIAFAFKLIAFGVHY